MPLLARKGFLAIAAVVDVALHSMGRPVSAKALASRHGLPPRHLEPVLQALVHDGILKGIRGPRGGYELAREMPAISAGDILRAAGTVDEEAEEDPTSPLLTTVVAPALAQPERLFAEALNGITLDSLVHQAKLSPASLEKT